MTDYVDKRAVAAITATALTALALVTTFSGSKSDTPSKPIRKSVSDSAVSYRCKLSVLECDENGRCFGGELLKLLDVAAGIVAAKHAGSPCVTISADRVLFLQELRVGDVVHLSSAVNRSWGSSCEIGVRVMRESPDMPPGVQSYCCHAYFTFVAKPVPNPPPSTLARLSHALGITTLPPATRKFQLPELVPSSTLETKRFLLAGRRRAHRLQRAKQNDALLSSMRDEVLRIEKEVHASERVREEEHVSSDAILALQTEVMVEAYMRQDPDVKVVGNEIVAEIEGFMDPVRLSRDLVEKASREKGLGGYRRLSVPETDSFAANTPATLQAKRLADLESPLELKDTLVLGLWIVRPQHANSKHVLFGGCLMRWAEEMAAMCSRRVLPTASWSSASIDALTFRSAVLPGEVVYIRAVVTKVWDSSIEVFIVAQAEDRNSPKPTMRLVSESFFSLIAVDPVSGRPLKGALRRVSAPESGPARILADTADQRRESRLLDKRILQRVYA